MVPIVAEVEVCQERRIILTGDVSPSGRAYAWRMAKYSYEKIEDIATYYVVVANIEHIIARVPVESNAKLIVDALNAYTPPVEPVPCVCGEVATMNRRGNYWNARCSIIGCWDGPIKPTREEAIEAWNAVMGK